MTLRFGTDGVRGLANAQLTPEFVTALGRAVARNLDAQRCAVGRDTRSSGTMVGAALAAGLAAEGVDVVDLGVVPTPAVAFWAEQHGQPGAVISASHNPHPDNGIKFFAAGGHKLTDDQQHDIEAALGELLDRRVGDTDADALTGESIGVVTSDPGLADAYVDHLVAEPLEGRSLSGMNVVVDAANGAASRVAVEVFKRLDATVTAINTDPDGVNINAGCGSTHPDMLARTVVNRRADLGLALDGDADRLVAVDEAGNLVDGDALLALFAIDMDDRGHLTGRRVVATVMSNLGLERALGWVGIELVRCPVGDRHVLAALESQGASLGGEQSGHLIFTEHATTGDGLLAGVLLADALKRAGRPLSELTSIVEPVPQLLRNVRLSAPMPDLVDRVSADITAAEARLGDDGRVLIRLSGTEPLARVMVEAIDGTEAAQVAAGLVEAVERVAGS